MTSEVTRACCVPITQSQFTESDAEGIATKFKALSDPVRVQLLNLLASTDEMCVCDFEEPLGISQPTVSYHLKILTQAGILRRTKRGKWVYYSLHEEALDHLRHMLHV